LHIAQDVLHHGEVRLSGIVHMEVDLLDGIGDVRADERRYWMTPMRLLN
jgi:hypothetical protein